MIDDQQLDRARRCGSSRPSAASSRPSRSRNCIPTSRSTTPTRSSDAGIRLSEEAGRVVRARKIGLTSKVMQDAVGVNEPDSGVIYDDMFYGPGDTVPFDRFIAPRIEVELAFVLGTRAERARLHAGGRARGDVVRDAGDRDPRHPDPDEGPRHRLDADDRRHRRRQRRRRRDHRRPPALRRARDRHPMGVRRCCAATGGSRSRAWPPPCSTIRRAVGRLARQPAGRQGVTLQPGELILAGSFTRPVWVRAW